MKFIQLMLIVVLCFCTTSSFALIFEKKNPFLSYDKKILKLREGIKYIEMVKGTKGKKKSTGLILKKSKIKVSKKALEAATKNLAKKMVSREKCVDEYMIEANKELDKYINKKETSEMKIEKYKDRGGRENQIKSEEKMIAQVEVKIEKLKIYLEQLKEWEKSLPEEEEEEDE